MIVLDARVLIAHLDANDQHHAAAVDLLTSVAVEDFAASVITVAEVLVGPARSGHLEPTRQAMATLLVEQLDLSGDSAQRLAMVRAQSGLRLPDCCVLLAAEDHGGTLATFDARLGRAATNRGVLTLGAVRRDA